MDLVGFVLEALPSTPARVLEVGCGTGRLARAMKAAGYQVLAIDPLAPVGPIFRQTRLEDLQHAELFEAVVATYSLHHIEDVDVAVNRIADLLEPEGCFVIEEFGWDLVDEATAAWYGRQQGQRSVESVLADWRGEHDGHHGYAAMRRALDDHFVESEFEWRPYLLRCLDRGDLELLERYAIARGEIRAVGFRYVGIRR